MHKYFTRSCPNVLSPEDSNLHSAQLVGCLFLLSRLRTVHVRSLLSDTRSVRRVQCTCADYYTAR